MTDYEKAIGVLERQSARLGGTNEGHLHFHSKYAGYYFEYVALLVQDGQVDRAFEILEQSRAQTLLRTLAEGHVTIRTGVPPMLLRRDRRLRQCFTELTDQRLRLLLANHTATQLAEIDKKIDEIQSEEERTEAQIRMSSPRYAAFMRPRPLKLQEIQRLLDGETLLLEYSLGDEQSHVFALTREGLSSFQIPERAVIDSMAKRVYERWATHGRSPSKVTPLGAEKERQIEEGPLGADAELSRAVLGPVAGMMKSYRRVVIVCEDALQYIPFAALPLPGSSPSRPVIADHELVTLPSASILSTLRQRSTLQARKYANTVAIVADPVFDADDSRVQMLTGKEDDSRSEIRNLEIGQASLLRSITDTDGRKGERVQLPRLRFSRLEAKSIAAVVPKGSVYEALDFAASREVVTSPAFTNSRILHFATHAFLDTKAPELSGLVFSLVDRHGRAQVGFWGLEEVFNSSLPVDLVVLSGCQTGLGEEVDSEGLVGLTWGFMYAGAKSVLASLWNVDDEGTAELMRFFYDAMENAHMAPSAALRKAQTQMSQQPRWASPYYWAGFVIQGDWDRSFERAISARVN